MQQRHSTLRSAFPLLLCTICTLLSLSSTDLSAHAQSFKPSLTTQPGNAFVDGKALYILNGRTVDGLIAQQTFMIDLSVSWNANAPVYKALSQGPGASLFPTAMTADGQKWFALVNGVGHIFDIQSNQWSQVFNYSGASGISGHGAAADPATGKIYIPFAYRMPDETFNMLIVDLRDESYTSDNNNFTLSEQSSYTVAWSAYLKSLLFINENGMHLYSLSGGWRNFSGPPDLTATSGYCLVSSSSGSKVVLFGGYTKNPGAVLGDIFILDVSTLTWKKGPSTSPGDARRYPACALSNEHVIVWGGDTGNASTVALVYNLKTDSWTSDYTAPVPTDTNPPGDDWTPPPPVFTDPGLYKQLKTITIIVSIILGGLLFVCCCGCLSGICSD